MHVVVSKKDLLRVLGRCQGVADKKSTMPVLGNVLLEVSDTGCGMSADTASHIFEPFFTTKEDGVGTGLGLSMVYGIVKQHDGHINVYSEVGHGTTFKIFLPIVERSVEKVELAIQLPLLGGTETILVAEDEEGLRNLARDILEGLGYTVLLASNGEEALKRVARPQATKARFIITLSMPTAEPRTPEPT